MLYVVYDIVRIVLNVYIVVHVVLLLYGLLHAVHIVMLLYIANWLPTGWVLDPRFHLLCCVNWQYHQLAGFMITFSSSCICGGEESGDTLGVCV